jgi:hypothetical protein
VAVVTTHLVTGGEGLRPAIVHRERPVCGDFRQSRSRVIRSVAVGALCVSAMLRILRVAANPILADRMHAVGTAVSSRRRSHVTNRTLHDFAGISLQAGAVEVVVRLKRRVLGML